MAVNFRGKLDAVHRVDQVHILDDVLHFIGLQVSDKVYLCILGIEILFGQVFLHPVFSQGMNAAAYGVVDCKGESLKPGESVPMVGVVEKPKADVAPSNLAVVGRYVLSADIWPLLAKTPPGAGDEIQLTDAIDMLIEKETVEAYHMKGKSHDCGNKLGYMQAFVEYGIRHNTLGTEFKAWLEEEMGIKK